MHGFTLAAITDAKKTKLQLKLTKSMDREIWVKVSGSRCVLEGHVKDNYNASFHTHIYH